MSVALLVLNNSGLLCNVLCVSKYETQEWVDSFSTTKNT